MNDIMQILLLSILGLLLITRLQAHKNKDLKKDIQKTRDTVKQTEKELEKIDEVHQKITTITQEAVPEKIEPPESGDSASRLDRLNRLHEHTDGRGQ